MTPDWDILLDGVSIRDKIQEFQVRKAKYTFVDELTLTSVDPDFFDSIDYTKVPELRVQVKIKVEGDWISLGYFYIEKPVYDVTPSQKISSGIWGRSQTAKAGEPFAKKITKTWTDLTSFQSVMSEVAAVCGLSIEYEINDYTIYPSTYSAEMKYPIEIIQELCIFSGSFVTCNSDGALVIKKEIFHASAEDYEISDDYIREISESITFPSFGNRVKVSSFSSNSGYSIEVVSLENDSACLPADGETELVVLAFITLDGLPAQDNLIVNWTTDDGISVEKETSTTGSYLIDHQKHNASNYHQVTVDYSIQSVVGIWAYADTAHQHNFWDSSDVNCYFEDKTITVRDPFTYCDQTLIITYITSGCAVNKVISGEAAVNAFVHANIEGAEASLEVKLGNPCACGSTLNMKAASSEAICFGYCGRILVWATISNEPAIGYRVTFEKDGDGYLSAFKKTLGYVDVYAEIATVFNVINGVSQVKTSMPIREGTTPRVYRLSSNGINRYESHEGQIIDLTNLYETGVELLVYYTAAGAATVSWCASHLDDDVEESGSASAEITAILASGSEVNSRATVSVSGTDCTVVIEPDPPIPPWPEPDPFPEPDPEPEPWFPVEPVGGYPGDDNGEPTDPYTYPDPDPDPEGLFPGESDGDLNPLTGTVEGDDTDDNPDPGGEPTDPEAKEPDPEEPSGGGALSPCDVAIINRIVNYDSILGDEEKSDLRFDTGTPEQCELPACTCEEMCESEVYEKGNTYDNYQTINEQTLETYEEGTPEYTELFEQIKTENISSCVEDCESAREASCGDCEVTGVAVMDPGESAEFICSDGSSQIITMPEDACGTQTFTIGCCTFEVRSSVGNWVPFSTDNYGGGTCGWTDTCSYSDYSEPNGAGEKCSGIFYCFIQSGGCVIGEEAQGSGSCDPCPGTNPGETPVRIYSTCSYWSC